MNEAQFTVFLWNTEPARAVWCVRGFINAHSNLVLEDFDNIIEDAHWNGNVSVYPGNMLNGRNDNWGKILVLEASLLGLCPGQCQFIDLQDVLEKLEFLRPQ